MASYEQASVEMTVAYFDPLPRFVFRALKPVKPRARS